MTNLLNEILSFAKKLSDENFIETNETILLNDLIKFHARIYPKLELLDDSGSNDTISFLIDEFKDVLMSPEIEGITWDDLIMLERLMTRFVDITYNDSSLMHYQACQVIQALYSCLISKKQKILEEASNEFLEYLITINASSESRKIVQDMITTLKSDDGISECQNIFQSNIKSLNQILLDQKKNQHFLKPWFDFFNQEYPILQVQEENEMIPDEFLKNFKIRLDAFAQGAQLVCVHADKRFNFKDISDLEDKYYLFISNQYSKTKKVNSDKYKHLLHCFKNELAALLDITPKDIQQGEAYWAWQTSNTRIKCFESSIMPIENQGNKAEVKLTEKFVNLALTNEQKTELLSIFSQHPPLWFSKRNAWEQNALKNDLRQALDLHEHAENLSHVDYNHSGWAVFANRTIPATLKWLPIVGASEHILQINTKCYRSYRVSVPVPYDAHHQTQQHLTHLNMGQIHEGLPLLNQEFLQKDRNMVLVSLLTGRQSEGWLSYIVLGFYDYVFGKFKPLKEYNAKMVATAEKAIQESSFAIAHYNFGVNWFRHRTPALIPDEYIASLQDENPFKRGIEEHHRLVQKHQIFDWENRNPNLYAAALIDVSERFSEGISIGHCKSSKDRKGIELLIADAMIVYHHLYGEVPHYNDTGTKRENFIAIIVPLFESGIYSDVAAFHSPGSRGLKDEYILPYDIKKALADNYKNSKIMAAWNKPNVGWLLGVTQKLSEPRVQLLVCTICMGLTFSSIMLGGPLAPLFFVGVGGLLTEMLATLHQYQSQTLEQALRDFDPKKQV